MTILYILLAYEFVVITAFSILPRIKKDKSYNLFIVAAIIVFLIICASRQTYFPDTSNYITMYERVEWGDLKTINILAKEPKSYTEYGFVLIMLIFKTLHIPFEIMSIVIAIFSIYSLYYFCKTIESKAYPKKHLHQPHNNEGYFLAFFPIYLPLYGVFYNFVAIRSSISFSFVALSVAMLYEKKYVRSAAFIFCGFCVQRMTLLAIVPMFILLIWKREIKKNVFVLLWIVCGAILLVDYWYNFLFKIGMELQVIWNSIMHTDIKIGMQDVSSHALKRFLLFVAYWFNGAAFIAAYERVRKHSNMLIVYILTIVLGSFVSGFSASYRIVDYFYLFSLPLNYLIIKDKMNYKRVQSLLVAVTMCFFTLSWGIYFYQYIIEP